MKILKIYISISANDKYVGLSSLSCTLKNNLVSSFMSVQNSRNIKNAVYKNIWKSIHALDYKPTHIVIYSVSPIVFSAIEDILQNKKTTPISISIRSKILKMVKKNGIDIIYRDNPQGDNFNIVKNNSKYILEEK